MKNFIRPVRTGFALLLLTGLASSCQKEFSLDQNPPEIATSVKTETVTFHDGKDQYVASAEFSYDQDGVVLTSKLIPGPDDAKITDLLDDPNVGLFIADEKNFYLYHNEHQLPSLVKSYTNSCGYFTNVTPMNCITTNTNSFACPPQWKLFKDYNNLGTQIPLFEGNLSNGLLSTNVNWVGSAANDNISVVQVRGGEYLPALTDNMGHRQTVTLYKDINYGGNKITFWSFCCCNGTFYLKNYIAWWILFVPISWNDQASSFRACGTTTMTTGNIDGGCK